LFLPLLAAACHSEKPPAPPETAGDPSRAVRGEETKLVDLLADATIESPLSNGGGGEPVDRRELLRLDFEKQREKDLRWRPSSLGQIVPSPDGKGRALAVRPSARRPLAVMLPAEPGVFYRVQRSIRGPRGAVELFVLEMAVAREHDSINHPEDLAKVLGTTTQAASFVKLRALIGQRRFKGPPSSDTWTQEDLVFFSSRDTRSLLLVFQSLAKEHRDAQPVFFDDIHVEMLEPNPNQRLALIRERYGLGATGGEAVSAFAQFLPVPAATRAKREEEVGFEYRHGVIAPAGTTITWTLPIAPAARLSLGLALLKESPVGARVRIRARAGEQVLVDELVDESLRHRFRHQDVDLSALSGTTVPITLEATAEGEPGIAVITNPTVWSRPPQPTPPAVYLVAVDTLRADRLSLYGCARPTSPHLEALAKDGVTFTNAIAQSNWTPESFASLFTSQYSARHGVTQRLSVLARNELAHLLRNAGYTTQAIAYKLLLYDMGFERGFDAYFNVPKFHLTQSYMVRAEDNWSRAEPWLATHVGRQVFLFFHLNDPHQPFNHEGDSLHRFTPRTELESHGLSLPILITNKTVRYGGGKLCTACVKGGAFSPWFTRLSRSLYDGEVAYTDEFVGRFVDKLRALNAYDEALIIFLSDHGEGLADHEGYIGHGFHHLHDEQIRVPLLIKPPRSFGMAGGVRVESQVRLIDLLPTLLELLNLESETPLSGKSLVGLMRGEREDHRIAISENVGARAIAVRDGRFKYILRYHGNVAREHLYDLSRDPNERDDLFAKPVHRRALAGLRYQAAEHIARTHPGRFILFAARDGSPASRLHLKLRGGSATVRPILGRLRGNQRGRKWRFDRDKAAPHLLVLAAVSGAPSGQSWEARLHGVSRPGGRANLPAASQWKPFAEAVPVRFGEHGFLTAGDNPQSAAATKESVSGEQLEALEALGYVDR
jgi:arylsulfatase A-like enzyme